MIDESKIKQPRGRCPFANVLTVAQVAELKGYPHQSVMSAIYRGDLPAWRFGNAWAVPRKEAERWSLNWRKRKKEANG